MKKLTVALPYKKGKDDKTDAQEMTLTFLYTGVAKKFPNGVRGAELRTWARIQNKIDESVDKKSETIDFEDTEFELIKKITGEDVEFHPSWAVNIALLQDEIERVAKESK